MCECINLDVVEKCESLLKSGRRKQLFCVNWNALELTKSDGRCWGLKRPSNRRRIAVWTESGAAVLLAQVYFYEFRTCLFQMEEESFDVVLNIFAAG